MAKSFRDLKVWSQAIELSILVYAVTADFPKTEIYGLSSQMRRAAVSIASNIAEGLARVQRKTSSSLSQSLTAAIANYRHSS